MIFNIDIQGDELNELTDIVTEINAEQPGANMTRNQYLKNLCMNFLTPRVRNVFVLEAMSLGVDELKTKLGNLAALKAKHRRG